MSTAGDDGVPAAGKLCRHAAVWNRLSATMKQFLTWCALLLCGGITAAALAKVARIEMQATPAFDRPQLETWLTKPDATDNTSDTELRRAAWLLEQDFSLKHDWSPFFNQLDADAQLRFQARWNRLLGEMFVQRSRRYAAAPSAHRDEYLNSQLAVLNSWYALDARGRHVSGPSLFMQESRFTSAFDRLDKTTRSNVAAFRAALGKAATDRLLKQFLPGDGPQPPQPRDD
jgi:hypothetical protein